MPSRCTTKQKYLLAGIFFITRSIRSALVHMKTNFFRATIWATIWSILGWRVGSPPAIETIGAPDASTAAIHCSTVSWRSMTGSYSRIRPQPSQARLQASRGSSIVTSGKRFLLEIFCLKMYQPIRAASSMGLPIDASFPRPAGPGRVAPLLCTPHIHRPASAPSRGGSAPAPRSFDGNRRCPLPRPERPARGRRFRKPAGRRRS